MLRHRIRPLLFVPALAAWLSLCEFHLLRHLVHRLHFPPLEAFHSRFFWFCCNVGVFGGITGASLGARDPLFITSFYVNMLFASSGTSNDYYEGQKRCNLKDFDALSTNWGIRYCCAFLNLNSGSTIYLLINLHK